MRRALRGSWRRCSLTPRLQFRICPPSIRQSAIPPRRRRTSPSRGAVSTTCPGGISLQQLQHRAASAPRPARQRHRPEEGAACGCRNRAQRAGLHQPEGEGCGPALSARAVVPEIAGVVGLQGRHPSAAGNHDELEVIAVRTRQRDTPADRSRSSPRFPRAPLPQKVAGGPAPPWVVRPPLPMPRRAPAHPRR
jgi:hypothetical protein